jgi:predicted GNAT family acetyltransferase
MTGQSYASKSAQRVWELREVLLPTPTHGHLRSATASDAETLSAYWYGFHQDVWGDGDLDAFVDIVKQRIEDGKLYVWEVEGQPVSMAIKTRPVQHGISVGMVYTPPELRGRGYATACVGELSRLLLDSGWAYCSLFTDLANPISNHVYEKIGYRSVCDYDKYTFV